MTDFTQEAADRIRWWHTMTLPGGVVTKGHYDPTHAFNALRLPDLHGKTIADVGAWDGFFSFEAERRGAAEVTAVDHHIWHEPTWGRAGFDFARAALKSNVKDIDCDVMNLAWGLALATNTQFDVVIFSGVLYHMAHPLRALENVFSITREQCVIETHLGCLNVNRPAMEFYEGSELGNDPSNWCGPNPACVCAMARVAGFARCEPVWVFGDRGVFHAWR